MSQNNLINGEKYRLETLSGQPLGSLSNESIDISNNLKNLEKFEESFDNKLSSIQIAFLILSGFIAIGIVIWIFKLLGKLPAEFEKILLSIWNSLTNFFKLLSFNGGAKETNNENDSPIVSLTAPPTPYKTINNSQINNGKDVPDETQDINTDLPLPGSQARVVSNAQTWVEGNDPREITKSQISVPPTPLPQQGNPDPVDTLENSDSKKNAGYCYIGEDRGFRSCIYVNDYNKCLSGQVFPNEALCINPNFR